MVFPFLFSLPIELVLMDSPLVLDEGRPKEAIFIISLVVFHISLVI